MLDVILSYFSLLRLQPIAGEIQILLKLFVDLLNRSSVLWRRPINLLHLLHLNLQEIQFTTNGTIFNFDQPGSIQFSKSIHLLLIYNRSLREGGYLHLG